MILKGINNIRRFSLPLIFFLILNSCVCDVLTKETPSPEETPTVVVSTPTELVIATFAPALEGINFPSQEVDYPSDWPADLVYPDEFIVVEASGGSLPGSEAVGWTAKLLYPGSGSDAEDSITDYFMDKEWFIADRETLGDVTTILFIENADKSVTGIVTIGSDISGRGETKLAILISFK